MKVLVVSLIAAVGASLVVLSLLTRLESDALDIPAPDLESPAADNLREDDLVSEIELGRVESPLPVEETGGVVAEESDQLHPRPPATRDLASLDRLHQARFGGMTMHERREALILRLDQIDDDLYRSTHIQMLNAGDYEELGEIERLESDLKRVPFSKYKRRTDVPFVTMMHESLTGYVVRTTIEMEDLPPGQQALVEEVAWLWHHQRDGASSR